MVFGCLNVAVFFVARKKRQLSIKRAYSDESQICALGRAAGGWAGLRKDAPESRVWLIPAAGWAGRRLCLAEPSKTTCAYHPSR